MTTQVGPIGLATQNLKDTLAQCYHFLRWVDDTVWTVEQAKQHIHINGIPRPPEGEDEHSLADLKALRPFVEIYLDDNGVEMNLDATPNHYIDSGVLIARFEQDVAGELLNEKSEVESRFDLFIDNVIRTENDGQPGLIELAAIPGNFFPHRITITPAVRTPRKRHHDLGDAIARYVMFDYGATF